MRRHTDEYLTPEAIGRLRRDLKDLRTRQRPLAAAEMRRTAEMGDLSENAGYSAAKAQLMRINHRILSIEERLKCAVPIARGSGPSGRIRIGSTVVVSRDGREQTFDILGSQESNPTRGRISHRSPLGTALLGHHTGDDVTAVVNGRDITYRIIRVT
ncbi:GreA/GreB family elongation factor [Candidatus Uhrbacteria bacterium]|nr:GreA/GreB family elongation factor [Candidatus Uhrbacteria bacterium]